MAAAIVTGSAAGIGRAIAGRLARDGAAVVIADVDGSSAQATADELQHQGLRSIAMQCDVADESAAAQLVARVLQWGAAWRCW